MNYNTQSDMELLATFSLWNELSAPRKQARQAQAETRSRILPFRLKAAEKTTAADATVKAA